MWCWELGTRLLSPYLVYDLLGTPNIFLRQVVVRIQVLLPV